MSHGFIIPIGGAESKIRDREILRRFVELCDEDALLVILPTASQADDTGPRYQSIFGDLGARRTRVLQLHERADCRQEEPLRVLEEAGGVFFTGGNQLRLSTTIGGTPVAELLRRRNREEALHVAGTSAGAAFMSEHMIAFGEEGATPRSDMVTLVPGLGLTRMAIIDQHFSQRDRLGRLLTALAYNPRPIGVGLDEDTAAFMAPDGSLEVVGSGAITIIDPSDVEHTSMDSARPHDPVCVIGARLHVLTRGATYDILTRRARPPDSGHHG